tara:strand:- start:2810 stop:4297 length:1488 start_codon:yes stop_codon:yes gene_type:complete
MIEIIKPVKKLSKLINFQYIFLPIVLLFLFSFLTQFYSIDQEVIDWDESDFILMGQSFYKGNLPYIELWDLKPPMHFLLIGLTFKTFGPTFLVARLLGDFLVFVTSVLVFHIARHSLERFESFLASSLYISFVSFEFSQPTMTEYTSTFFILLGIFFIYKDSNTGYFLGGIFVSLSILTRTNSAFVFLFFILFLYKKFGIKKKLVNFIFGSVIPLLVLVIIYTSHGALKVFLYSVFLIPLRNTLIRDNFFVFLKNSFQGIFLDSFFSIPLWILIFSFFVIFLLLRNSKLFLENLATLNTNKNQILIITFFALTISILAGGRFFYHYLIQLFPFLAIFIFLFVKQFINSENLMKFILITIMVINFLPLGLKSINNLQNYNILEADYKIKKFTEFIDKDEELLALDNHLIYFYLETKPLTPIVHPNTIFKNEEYSEIIKDLIDLGYIVKNQSMVILDNLPYYILCGSECKESLPENYLNDYQLIHNIDDINLYKLRS